MLLRRNAAAAAGAVRLALRAAPHCRHFAASAIASVQDPETVLCFGDSNTWGHDAESGGRFAPHTRWPGVLAAESFHINVLEAGLNGRTTVFDDPLCNWLAPNYDPAATNGRKSLMPTLHSAKPVDLVIIALGVNDLKSRFSATPGDIANGAGLLVEDIQRSGATDIHPVSIALLILGRYPSH